METAIIACQTLETELGQAMKNIGSDYPIHYMESGLHNTPAKLFRRLSELLGEIRADRVLLAMGFCGNSVAGIRAGDFELIIPRVDDCISLLLGSQKKRAAVSREYAAYFLTEGWMRGERNLWVEHQHAVKKYGEEMAMEIAEMLYGHYRTLALLDTGAEPIEPLVEKTKIIADTLHLEQKILPATVAYLEELLTGPWSPERFLVLPPGTAITQEDLRLD